MLSSIKSASLAMAGAILLLAIPLFPVASGEPAPADRVRIISATGTVEPEAAVEVGSQVTGTVTNVFVDFNSPVKQGEVLMQIDDTPYALRLDQSKAALKQTLANLAAKKAQYEFQQRTLNRAKALREGGAVPAEALDLEELHMATAQAELDGAEADVRVHETEVHRAMTDLDATKLMSPIGGIVIDRRVTVGQTVIPAAGPGQFLIAKDLHRMRLWLSVNETDVASVHPDQPVQFKIAAFPNAVFSGKVARVRLNATVAHNAVMYTVEIAFENPDLKVLPYMTADAQIVVGAAAERK